MYINNVDCDIIEMTCRQLGASQVRKIHGTLYIFEFDIGKDYKLPTWESGKFDRRKLS